MKERTLALSGVFQATELVRQAACHGTWSGYAAKSSLSSLFTLDADSIDNIYGDVSRLRLGVETLLAVLHGEARHSDTLRYVVSLLQIERKFRKMNDLQESMGERLAEIANHGAELEEHEREDLQAQEIAELYSDSISPLTPRIIVSGKPSYLKTDRVVNWVRTLLLAGLRSAVLWDQLGGGRFELMFSRKRLMKEAEALLMS